MAKSYNLNRLAYFVAVFETGSFTTAAERLGVGKSIVSRQIRVVGMIGTETRHKGQFFFS